MFQRKNRSTPSGYVTNTFLHHRYSTRVKLLFSFLMAGVCETLFKEVTNGDSLIKNTFDIFTVYPLFTGIFFILFIVLNGKKMHKFIITPLLYFAFGYSLASIIKTLFGFDMNLFTFTYWIMGITCVYSVLFRKFYTFTWYVFDSVMSIVFSFYIVFTTLTMLVWSNVMPENGGFMGLLLFVMFHICYLYFFRHRFSIFSGMISLLVAFVGTIISYGIVDSSFSFHNVLHSLYGGFLFTSIYAICVSFFTLFTKQPRVLPLARSIDKKPFKHTSLSSSQGQESIYEEAEGNTSPSSQYEEDPYDEYNKGYQDGLYDGERGSEVYYSPPSNTGYPYDEYNRGYNEGLYVGKREH